MDYMFAACSTTAQRGALDWAPKFEAATKAYYDTASEEELAEQREWAEMAGPSIVVDIDSAEAEL